MFKSLQLYMRNQHLKVNPEGDNAHGHGSMSNEDIARKKDRLDISYG